MKKSEKKIIIPGFICLTEQNNGIKKHFAIDAITLLVPHENCTFVVLNNGHDFIVTETAENIRCLIKNNNQEKKATNDLIKFVIEKLIIPGLMPKQEEKENPVFDYIKIGQKLEDIATGEICEISVINKRKKEIVLKYTDNYSCLVHNLKDYRVIS